MIATITTRAPKFSSSHRKENKGLHKCYAMLAPSAYDPGQAKAIAELRIYWAGSTAYACLWVNAQQSPKCPACGEAWETQQTTCPKCLDQRTPRTVAESMHTSGSGKAGGYGYDKPSAAAAEAIRTAGFDLSEDIAGVGETAIREAMKALAAAVGYPEAMLFETHP